MSNDELIKRAREFAELWHAIQSESGAIKTTYTSIGDAAYALGYWVIEVGLINIAHANQNSTPQNVRRVMRLMGDASEMAALLKQMADRLEKLESWARWKCRGGTCGASRAERGAHRNGCPVVELGIDQEGGQ